MSRFRGQLVKMIKNSGSKYDDYSISPKIRHILLHWGYKLTKKRFWVVKLICNNESLKRLNNSVTYDRGVWEMKNEKWEMRNEKWEQDYKLIEKDFF